MALSKLKQKNRDEVLDKASRSEHGLARLAHLNVVVGEVNKIVSPHAKVSTAVLIGRDFPDSAAAQAGGLAPGAIYHTTGDLKIVL